LLKLIGRTKKELRDLILMIKNMSKTQELPNLLTIRQAAKVINVHVETLRRWDKSGKFKAIIVNERGDRRYDPKDIEAILKNKKK